MFWEIILPIFRSTRLCVTQSSAPEDGQNNRLCVTQSSAPEDGQNNCPKHVELTGIISKLLLLHLVACIHYSYFILLFETC